jgi:hypothetical protein
MRYMRWLGAIGVGAFVLVALGLGPLAGNFPTVLGFAFGLVGALLVQWVVSGERRAKLAWVARDMLITEACFNLREIGLMDGVRRPDSTGGRELHNPHHEHRPPHHRPRPTDQP